MSKSNTFENDILKLIFWGTSIVNIADNAASSPLTSLYVALHTANPGETGNQATSECTYGSYTRLAISRSSSGTSITDNVVSPALVWSFPTATSGTQTASYASIGVAASGTSKILYYGALSPTISIGTGITPQISPSSTITED